MTVSARGIISNQTEENFQRHHADISFYFTVVTKTEKAEKK